MDDKNDDEQKIILEQWKTCVEMADSISRRRNVMNGLFVTLNLALVTTISVLFDLYKVVFIVAIGLILCILWLFFIINYHNMNKAKFEVINEMEEKLPVQAFQKEWKIANEKPHKYREQTKLELSLPSIFMVLYVGLTLFIAFV
ncbi:MAG: hypothetical protein LUD22_00055 [Coprobacillus sp.]|nr:hypothetical protein [Coprobacillus sp.]